MSVRGILTINLVTTTSKLIVVDVIEAGLDHADRLPRGLIDLLALRRLRRRLLLLAWRISAHANLQLREPRFSVEFFFFFYRGRRECCARAQGRR
jgi:hypothetical protein